MMFFCFEGVMAAFGSGQPMAGPIVKSFHVSVGSAVPEGELERS